LVGGHEEHKSGQQGVSSNKQRRSVVGAAAAYSAARNEATLLSGTAIQRQSEELETSQL
jgi:hypothetical protein